MKCPNAGKDERFLSWLICPLQWLLSWHSEKEPKLFARRFWCIGVCPPYFVINLPIVQGHIQFEGGHPYRMQYDVIFWRLFRVGWRFDKNWLNPKTGKKGGYIGPSAAWKIVNEPLLFY